MSLCHFRYSSVTHWACFLFIPCVSRLYTEVAPHHTEWSTTTHCGCSVSCKVSDCQSPWRLSVDKDVSLQPSGVALHCHRCFTTVYKCRSASFQISHCTSQGWLHILSLVPLPFTRLTLHHPTCQMQLTKMALCHSSCKTATHWSDSALSQVFRSSLCGTALSHVSHWHSLDCLCLVPCMALTLNWLASYCFLCSSVSYKNGLILCKCPITTHVNGFASLRVFYCCSLG